VPRTEPFDQHIEVYERWFDEHRAAYVSELLAVRALLPPTGRSLEIGVGTGLFAAPLGIDVGVDPSREALALAEGRGITTVLGTAESLPFPDDSFDQALAVTTICFVDSPSQMFAEAHRVLRPGGTLVVALVDRLSPLGQLYQENRAQDLFYRHATFYSTTEVEALLEEAGFTVRGQVRTLVGDVGITQVEPARPGTGDGAFVVLSAHPMH
jgi:SAM-dependent methyltransferase